jgi:hypothetical protein
MENQKIKGRPPKPDSIARRDHFSVWVTKDEKAQINQLIEKSNLSASQFFLTLALDVPIKRPQKKTLPAHTAETIRILEQLAGILSLAVLKTKDNQIHAEQWKQSSQQVRLLSKLITLWVFEEFEIRTTRKTLTEIKDWMQDLELLVSLTLPFSEEKISLLKKAASAYKSAKELLEKYERYYRSEDLRSEVLWKHEQASTDPGTLHVRIQKAVDDILNRIKR